MRIAAAISWAPPEWKICSECRRRHAIFRRILDAARHHRGAMRIAVHGQNQQISEGSQEIDRQHKARAQDQRERNVAAGILHFAGGEGDVVPCVGGEERADLHHGQNHQQIHQHHGAADAHLDRMHRTPAGVLPELAPAGAEVGAPCGCISSHRECEQNQRGQSESALAEVKMFWISAPSLTPNMFTMASRNDDHDAGEIGGVDADLHVAQHHRPHWIAAHAQCATASA